jgi:MinD superfamily P-loop ATPase
MKAIAVTGGKGGVGKSTITCLLANKLIESGKKIVLADLDVECPNDYLLLGEKLDNQIESIEADFPVLDKKKCQKCGKCVEVCQENAIFQSSKDEYPIFFNNLCSACGACKLACPYGAIGSKKEEIGKVFINKISENYTLVTGEARACLEETGPIVTKAREVAKRIAEEKKADYLIIDTAAGLHCPVISALLEVEKAYLVTEPTPLGVHDLKLIIDLLSELKIKSEIIINQSDMGETEKIEAMAKKNNLKIKAQIPFDKDIVAGYSKGKMDKVSNKYL